MSMSLTISQPAKIEFGGRSTHDFSPRISLAKPRLSPQPRVDSPVSSLRVSAHTESKMTSHHRGLPPPAAMTLPDPTRQPPLLNQPLGALPTPPSQWQGHEESMRHWLGAKAEEEKRKQEEEKTKQEAYKLDQRRIEQSMLRDSLNAGVPPSMVPMIYAGIGGSNLANFSLEWLQQYAAQLQAAQQQIQQSSPELRREQRLLGPNHSPYATPQQQYLPSQSTEQTPLPLQTTFAAFQGAPSRPPPTSAPRSATQPKLPRLTTNEMYVNQPTQQGPGSAHPLQQSQTVQQDQATSSPSIYFHHYVPPGESKSNLPQTPHSKGEPHSAYPSSHLSESDYKESPRKRKAQGPHQPAPAPSLPPQYTSPSFSTASSTSGRKGYRRDSGESRPGSRREPDVPQLSNQESGQSSEERLQKESTSPLPPDGNTGHLSAKVQHEHRTDRPDSRDS